MLSVQPPQIQAAPKAQWDTKEVSVLLDYVRVSPSRTPTWVWVGSKQKDLENINYILSQTTSDLCWEQVPDNADLGWLISDYLRARLLLEILERKVSSCHPDF